MLTKEDLQTYVGTGVATLHAWACKVPPPSILTIEARPQESMFPTTLRVINAENWIIHDIRIDGSSQLSVPTAATEFFTHMPLLPRLRVGAHVQLDIEYIGDLIAGDRFYAMLMGASTKDTAEEASEAVVLTPTRSVRSLAFASEVQRPTRPTRILLDLGDVAHEFRLRRERREELFYRCTLHSRAMIEDTIADIVDHEGAVQRPSAPIMVSLRVNASPMILYGTAENTSDVLFEMGERGARCDLGGYVPSWWKTIDESLEAAS